ncbi:MAG: SMI1/KNR4 family protein [Bacillota bacterium]
MTAYFEQTLERLGQIADRLRQSGMADMEYEWTEGSSTSELTALEERLQRPLPASLSELIQRCGSLYLLWSLPQHCIVASVGVGTFASTRAYLTARCLPGHEGLAYVCNYLLQHFHSPQVIDWMRDKMNHPVEGWAALFAHSGPTTKQLLEWLSDSELHQKITTEALNIMIQRDLLPTMEADAWANISDLLHTSLQLVMLKKDKRRIQAVLEQLSDLEHC